MSLLPLDGLGCCEEPFMLRCALDKGKFMLRFFIDY